MHKFFLVACLCYIVVIFGATGNYLSQDVLTPEELNEVNNLDYLDFPSWSTKHARGAIINVDDFGAVGDGVADDTQAFSNAWYMACSTKSAVLMVPKNGRYLVSSITFKGPCEQNLAVQIDGTIVAPDVPASWDPKNIRNWLSFSDLDGVVFLGKGGIDGSGGVWWPLSCKKNKSMHCTSAPTAFSIVSSRAVLVKGFSIINSPQIQFSINRCDSVKVYGMQIASPGDSPNTDGIHITQSTNVMVQNVIIKAGDDCVSIVNGSSVIKMSEVVCGPGHGISIGSLGKDKSLGIVTQVVLDTSVIRDTTNGLRIKTWPGAIGYVRGVLFQKVRMHNVSNAIIIDQNYCDSPTPCEKQDSSLQISKIFYNNIVGSVRGKIGIKFNCSNSKPCLDLVVRSVKLVGVDSPAETVCVSAYGRSIGNVEPAATCLTQYDTDMTTREEL